MVVRDGPLKKCICSLCFGVVCEAGQGHVLNSAASGSRCSLSRQAQTGSWESYDGSSRTAVARVSVLSSMAIAFVAIRNLELVGDADMSELAGIRSLELLGESDLLG